ncbi:MAG: cytochrome c [Terriglobales bacterium]
MFGTKPALVILALALLFSAYALADGGAEIYKAKCSACHGASGAGDTMLGRNMTLRALGSDEVQRQSDEELASITSRGKNKMPAYDRKLSKDQIAAVVKFIRSLKK